MAGSYYHLLRDRAFVGYALTGAMGTAGMFAYIVGSPFVFMNLFHVPANRYGLFFGVNALGLIMASQLNVRLVRRFETDEVIRKVLLVQLSAAVLLFVGTAAGVLGLYGTALLLFTYVGSIGCLFPNTTALAMAPHPERAGSASALVGVLQFSLAAIAAAAVGAANNGTAFPMALVIGTCGVAAVMIHRAVVSPQVLDFGV